MFISKGGARVFEDFKRIENKFPEAAAKVRQKSGAAPDDLIVLVVGSTQSGKDDHPAQKRKVTPAELAVYASAGLLRVALGQKYAAKHGLFKRGRFPFSMGHELPDVRIRRDRAPLGGCASSVHIATRRRIWTSLNLIRRMVRALAYDVVLNGTELGSGSIRIHRQDIQRQIFHRPWHGPEEEAKSRFGFFLGAVRIRHAAARRHRPWGSIAS